MTRRLLPYALPLALLCGGPLWAAPILAPPDDPLRALTVDVVEARLAPSLRLLAATGTVEAAETLSIAFPTGGRVLSLQADIGDRVREGAVLAELDPVQTTAVLRAAEAQLAAAEAGLVQALATYDRAKGLIERGATTRAALDTAEQEWRRAEANLDEARAGRDKAVQALADTRILAPSPGIITRRTGEVGQVIGAGQTLFQLATDGPREAQFHLPALPGLERKLGQRIEVRSLDGDAARRGAVISEIAPLVDSATGTMTIRAQLEMDGTAETMGLGTPLDTSLSVEGPLVFRLPAAALIWDRGQPAVWIIDPASATVSLAPVTLARFTSDAIEITEGLTEGSLIAGSGAQLLFPGRSVQAAKVSP